jgi:hypothetical protein
VVSRQKSPSPREKKVLGNQPHFSLGELMLRPFTTNNRWWDSWIGGGWTVETIPTSRGWRAVRVSLDDDRIVIGRRGMKGCLTATILPDFVGRLATVLVAIYLDQTPEDVLKDEKRVADSFYDVPFIPGWALEFIQKLEKGF